MKRYIITLLGLLWISSFHGASAQQYISEALPVNHYQRGTELLDKKKYGAAREEFQAYLQQQPGGAYAAEAQYYAAYSAIRLYNPDGESMLAEFIRENPSHPKALRANYELGNFYFRDEEYGQAIEAFEAADARNLTREDEATRNFKLAYAYFTRQKFKEAEPLFNTIKSSDNVYRAAASYYSGYIALQQGNYEQALEDLRRAEQEESYARQTPYLIASVFSRQGQYDRLIEYGEKMIERAEREEIANVPELTLMVGDAYYEQENFTKAKPYLQAYAEAKNPDAQVQYRLAYSQYQTGDIEPAIENFKPVASSKDSLGQYASYYLGVLYTKQDNPQYAATAFETAANRSFSSEIQEQALYNLGKVYLATGDFARTLQTLQKFKENYPNSEYTTEVNDLLSEAYLNSQNYGEAMQFIESLPNKTQQVRRAYQKVSFFAGTQAFNRSKYPQAVQLFKKSTDYPIDPEYVAAANFWAGEAFSIGKRYDQAIAAYEGVFDALRGERLTGEKAKYNTKARYGLGYVYFNTKEYTKAREQFEAYLKELSLRGRGENKDEYFYDDALVRLADTYYVTKAYDKAVQTYDRAIRERNPDIAYAYYQKGIIQGIQGQYRAGIDNLDKVVRSYPDSPYRDDAMLQKAQLNFEQTNYDAAINGFTQLIKTYPQSNLVPYALLRRALAYSNQNNYRAASQDYKAILDSYGTHKTANSALLGLQEVSRQTGNTSEFSTYLARYKEANPENENVASIEYESAKNLYFSQDYNNAIEQLNDFINNYPNHPSVDEARYYIGESYYRAERPEQALEVFYEVEANGRYPRMSRVVQRIAELEQADGNEANAITYYQKLANQARNKKEQYAAWSGLMSAYYRLAQSNPTMLDSVDKYAELIIERGNVSANAVNQALLFQGKAAYEQDDLERAKALFERTVAAAQDENGAEAQYMLAQILYDQGQHQESIEALYELNKKFSIYENWLGQSFLLVADNYIALDEAFQAEATLNSVIENSPVESVVAEAKQKLRQLEDEERQEELERKEAEQAAAADSTAQVPDSVEEVIEADSVEGGQPE